MRQAGKISDLTIPRAMLSAIFPAPMKPRLKVSIGIGGATTLFAISVRFKETKNFAVSVSVEDGSLN